jgi:hypothetical protein
MNKTQANILAEQITGEIENTTATVVSDECLLADADDAYHIDIYQQQIIRLCIRSEQQWEEGKHLLSKDGEEKRY